jgi:hypothetical protein
VGLRDLPGEPGVPVRHDFGSGLSAGVVDDLLVAGHQLGAGEGVQHWPGPEEVVGVTVGYEDHAGLLTAVLHPRRQSLSFARGEQRVDEDRVVVAGDQRRGAGWPRGLDAVIPSRATWYRFVSAVEHVDGQ